MGVRTSNLLLFAAVLLCLSAESSLNAGQPPGATLEAVDLRCEHLVDPLGIDPVRPQLSWRLAPTDQQSRGQRQIAYHILVASSLELLAQDKADFWNSGPVQSDQSLNVDFAGAELRSGQDYFWKLRVLDERGNWSSWSKTARWSMGLLRVADWKAKWIASPGAAANVRPAEAGSSQPTYNTQSDPWFRKSFDLTVVPSHAVIYVASVGYHELYVNGKKVGDRILAPSATDNARRARYVTYDITNQLRAGRNVIGLWLGVSWSIFPAYQTTDKPDAPIVLAQAEIDTPQGGRIEIATDETWKTHPSPNVLLGFWDAHGFGGEQYDANLDVPDWCGIALDDSDWKAASVFHPSLVVSADETEPNRLVKRLEPVNITEEQRAYRVDMGVNYAGWFEMQVSGQPGDRIEFEFSERPDQAMTFGLHSSYIIGSSGKGVFRNRFNYMAGRWIRITGLRYKPELNQMHGWLVRTDYRRAGHFECDQPLLNQVYQTTLWTYENLTIGSYLVDCPHRERRGYGDGFGADRTAFDNYDVAAMYTKWIQDWRDVQKPDGDVPFTAPTCVGGGGPAWSGYCVSLPWDVYRRYGDKRVLEESFPTIERWLAFLETKSRDDMLQRYGGKWGFLGDWQWPGFWAERSKVQKAGQFLGDTQESLFFNNCYWIFNLQTAARIADVLGNHTAADVYRQRADRVRTAVHRAFYKSADASYVNGFPAYLAIALLVDLPPEGVRPKVWNRMEHEIRVNHQGHIWAGIIGGGFLFETLLNNNRDDLIFSMISEPDYPGWGDMLADGATTFYEDWDKGGSRLHSSFLYAGAWFTEGLLGIRQSDCAYRHIIIDPWIDARQGPRKAAGYYDSPCGRIASSWTVDASGQVSLDLTIPPNTDAVVIAHTKQKDSILEGGQPIDTVPGLALDAGDSSDASVRTSSGHYHFQWSIAGVDRLRSDAAHPRHQQLDDQQADHVHR
jgi:hypothetical protein